MDASWVLVDNLSIINVCRTCTYLAELQVLFQIQILFWCCYSHNDMPCCKNTPIVVINNTFKIARNHVCSKDNFLFVVNCLCTGLVSMYSFNKLAICMLLKLSVFSLDSLKYYLTWTKLLQPNELCTQLNSPIIAPFQRICSTNSKH